MKKIISSFLILSLLGISIPKKAHAQFAVTDVALTAVAVEIGAAVGVTAQANESLTFKEFFLDQLAYMVAKMILRELTSSVVTWINSGFEGNPAFVTNPANFFKGIGDDLLGQMIQNDEYLGFLCSPFSIDLKLQLAFKYQPFQKRIACTLTDVIANASGAIENASINGFTRGDFEQGGWPAFVEMTTEPQNNLYGAYIQADYELSARIAGMELMTRDELNQGRGFLSFKKCTTDKDQIAVDQEVDDALADNPYYKASDPHNKYAQTHENNCDVYTPGSVIAGVLDANTTGPLQELHLADEINEIVNALFAQMVKQVLTSGLKGLSGNGARDPNSYISDLEKQQAGSNEQLQGIKDRILKGIDPFILKEVEFKTYKDQSLNKLLQSKNKLDNAKTCFINKMVTDPGLSTTQINFGESKIGEIESLIQIKVAPKSNTILSEVTSQDGLVNSLKKIKADAQKALNVNDISSAAQQYSTYTGSSDILHDQKDIEDAKIERDQIVSSLAPVDLQADRLMQQCIIFPAISPTSTRR